MLSVIGTGDHGIVDNKTGRRLLGIFIYIIDRDR
jgi:hypothetical protein